MAKTETAEKINGVNVQELKKVIARMNDSQQAKFSFSVTNRWRGGPHNQSRLTDYRAGGETVSHDEPSVLDCDEPRELTGQDESPNPVEYLLHSLAGCVTTSLVMHAAARGIEIRSLKTRIDGDIDVRGFLGIDPNVPKGYQRIRVVMEVDSDAPAEKLAELARFSPVYNTISQSVPVELTVQK